MEDDLNDVVPCSSLAVESTLRVGTAGALWGLCMAPYDSRKNGLSGIAHAAFVGKSVGKYGFQCGLVAGTFTLTHCGIQRYRRKNDWLNGLIAGAVAGAAIATRTRRWSQVIGMAGLVSVFSAAADYSRSL